MQKKEKFESRHPGFSPRLAAGTIRARELIVECCSQFFALSGFFKQFKEIHINRDYLPKPVPMWPKLHPVGLGGIREHTAGQIGNQRKRNRDPTPRRWIDTQQRVFGVGDQVGENLLQLRTVAAHWRGPGGCLVVETNRRIQRTTAESHTLGDQLCKSYF